MFHEKTHVFTIAACNYLAQARFLGESVVAQHPGVRFSVWLLDAHDSLLREQPYPPCHLRSVKEAFGETDLGRLVLRYDILELSTAVKPGCFRKLFEEGAEQVVYLDPDIVLFRPLARVFSALGEGATGVLTPHLLCPLPRDGALPDDKYILRSGVYNLGFLALQHGKEADELLSWWGEWVKTECSRDPSTGVFTDQKWMDFAPVFWPAMRILRDTAYNVAYWNLPQRDLRSDGTDWSVDGKPLVFFHFSGFDPKEPKLLSKHQNRIAVPDWPHLAKLLRWYADGLMARDYDLWARRPIDLPCFDNGTAVDGVVRRLFQEAQRNGIEFGNPLATDGADSFCAWVNERSPRDTAVGTFPPITRYLEELYHLRPDVMAAHPNLFGKGRAGFVKWVLTSGRKEHQIHDGFLRPLTEQASVVEAKLRIGVNVAGYVRTESGIGEAARGYIKALDKCNVPFVINDVSDLAGTYRDRDSTVERFREHLAHHNPHPVNLICVNADQVPVFRQRMGEAYFRNRYNIGLWAWETQAFPERWHDRFREFDEIWVSSSFKAQAIGLFADIPVVIMPHVIDAAALDGVSKAQVGFDPDEFVFLFVYDFHSVLARKNPVGLIQAFRKAFRPEERVRLVLKSVNGDAYAGQVARLQNLVGDARITLLDAYVDPLDRLRMLAACDAYVSLHRAEGFGLTLAEAMALEKPVIATSWGGNRDFMDTSNSFPVKYALRPLEDDEGPYPAGTIWAEPDLDDAVRQMRWVYEHPDEVRAITHRASADLRTHYGPEALGQRISKRLSVIQRAVAKPKGLGDRDVPSLMKFLRLLWYWAIPKLPPSLRPFAQRQGDRLYRLLHR